MEQKELNSLAKVIKNKIVQDSIILMEMRSTYVNEVNGKYEVNQYIENIPESAIVKNIIEGTDMNIMNGKSISWFVTRDLNKFLKEMISYRRMDSFIEESYILNVEESILVTAISNYLQYHTYEENLKIKKIFLKRYGICFPEMKEEDVERLFFDSFEVLKSQEQSEKIR